MKAVILLAMAAVASAVAADVYDNKYDDFDVDEVIGNTRLLKSYVLCFLSEGKCTPDGNTFKAWIPEAVQTDCEKCSDKQKVLIAKVIKATQAKLPQEWVRLHKLHDPDLKYTDTLDMFLKKYAA